MTVLIGNKFLVLSACASLSSAIIGEASASNLFGFPEEQREQAAVRQRQDTPYSRGKKSRIRITSPIRVLKSSQSQSTDVNKPTQKPIVPKFTLGEWETAKEKPTGASTSDLLGVTENSNVTDFLTSEPDHECSLSPIRPSKAAIEQVSPIPHYMGMMAEHTILEEDELLGENSVAQESFERKHYTKEMWEAFYQDLQEGVPAVFFPTNLEFVLMNDGYIYELMDSKLIALFKQSDPDFDWETLLTE